MTDFSRRREGRKSVLAVAEEAARDILANTSD